MHFLRSTNIKLLKQIKKINKFDSLKLRNFYHATKPSYATDCRWSHKGIRATFLLQYSNLFSQ